MRDEELVATSSRHVAEVRGINRELIEKALRMRCLAYLAHVKAETHKFDRAGGAAPVAGDSAAVIAGFAFCSISNRVTARFIGLTIR